MKKQYVIAGVIILILLLVFIAITVKRKQEIPAASTIAETQTIPVVVKEILPLSGAGNVFLINHSFTNPWGGH